MTSTSGSARDTPWQGQVKFVPSIRNMFSLTPAPKADTVLKLGLPLDGDVGDTPGVARIQSNMLYRRVGIALIYSVPKCVSNPLSLASSREPDPGTIIDSVNPFTFNSTVRSRVVLAPMRMSSS